MPHENDYKTNEYEHEVNETTSFQMPANLVVAEFGEVNVRRNTAELKEAKCHVEFTIAMEPQGQFAEGWRTGLALDASASMKRAYGRKIEARVDPELLTTYIKQGRLRAYVEDGEPTRKIQREAFAEIQEKGYEVNYTKNILQPLVQDFTAYLSGSLDGTGKTSIIYWGCGKGDEIQVLGEFDAASCRELKIFGPANFQLGKTTNLLPAIAYFTNQSSFADQGATKQYSQAQHGIYIFLTDGRIDDLEQVKNYTKELALEIAVSKRNYLKLILIGIGNDVDRYQLQELDDFDTGLDIDIWDYKIASEMTNLTQIFAEVVNENQIIAETGSIYDDAGICVKSYPKGLPAKVDFIMRDDSKWFELEVNNQRIRQSIGLEIAAIVPLVQKSLFDFEIKAQESTTAPALTDREIESDQTPILSFWWKRLAALIIGAAFIGTAIAFAILIKRSDENKFQNQSLPNVIKESMIDPKSSSINKSQTNSSTRLINRSTNRLTKVSPNNSSGDLNNATQPKNSDRLKTDPSDRNIGNLILPITNPEVEAIIFFPSDESQLIPSEEIKIDNFWTKVQKRRGIIQVSGHADKTGTYAYNLDLSQARANEVVRLLRDRGLDNNYKVTFEALSWIKPLRNNTTANDYAFNRRVVIQFKEQK